MSMSGTSGGETVYLQFGDLSNLAAVNFWNSQIAQRRLAVAPKETVEALGLVDSSRLFNFDCTTIQSSQHVCPRNVLFDRYRPDEQSTTSAGMEEFPLDESMSDLLAGLIQRPYRMMGRSGGGSWQDYRFYHQPPQSTVAIPDFIIDDHSDTPFPSFQAGQAFHEESFETRESAEEAIRRAVEGCDRLARFTPIIDAAGWWGGYAAELLGSVIADEYPRKRVEALGIFRNAIDLRLLPNYPQAIDVALGLTCLAAVTDTFIPVALEGSALGADIDTLSIHIAGILDTLATQSLLGYDLPDGVLDCYSEEDSSPYSFKILRDNVLDPGTPLTLDQSTRHTRVNLPIYRPVVIGDGYRLEAVDSSTVTLDPKSPRLSRQIATLLHQPIMTLRSDLREALNNLYESTLIDTEF